LGKRSGEVHHIAILTSNSLFLLSTCGSAVDDAVSTGLRWKEVTPSKTTPWYTIQSDTHVVVEFFSLQAQYRPGKKEG